ncbi:hypothetical protein INT43_001249 [Umbelopsis isabellina]|uniref:Putative lipoate-protein ligase A n=1 Tax=Mortierella isabellina TaxID=91625 RepID=A0A8H7PKA4_MORIS|nr:hypothetical protein INT43_001249 [Umbelopsis isabellina]
MSGDNVECFISTHKDPFVNLAIEDHLFKTTDPEKYILYLWRNKPCVVVGRNQNPFKECNLRYMEEHGIPLVRRRSGGGTVYHDMGNSIYTIFMPRAAFSRDANAELVARALLQLDIPAYVNSRHDIAVDGFKVSGSAYKLTNRRAYHHGTMLIDTDIEMLRGALGGSRDKLVTKGVASVPSPVSNLRSYSYTIDHQQFCEAVIDEFLLAHNGSKPVKPVIFSQDDPSGLPEEVQKSKDELTSWDWIYGQTPEFTHDIEMDFTWGSVNAFIRSRHGHIIETEIQTSVTEAQEIMVISAIEQALQAFTTSSRPSSLISTSALAKDSSIKILDGSWHMPNANRDPYLEFVQKRIPGAQFFGIDDIKAKASDLPHMLPSKDTFAEAVGKLGISNNDHVVIYDSVGVVSACRVYWTFRVFGHENVSVLNGGLPKWISENRPLDTNKPIPADPAQYHVASVREELVRDYDTIIKNVKNVQRGEGGFLVADARSNARFTGEAPEPRPSLSSGHMPGSVSMPFQNLMSGTEFLDDEALKQKWLTQIPDLNQEIVTSCGSGITASVLYFTLERIGAQNISVYDGSWTEYAGRKESVIVK